jgi:alpha-amylase
MVYLALAFHNHQPVGNFPHVMEQVWRDAYRPLIESLSDHPGLKVTLHTSGPLRDWLATAHPEWASTLARMVANGQAEVMGGAYYEPILPAIPDADKHGQLCKMNQAVLDDVGQQPRGAWLAERVWEPHLPKFIREAGLDYVVVDDSHLVYAGLDEDQLLGYYLTEEEGQVVAVFPSSTKLRYLIPWASLEDVQGYLRSLNERGDGVLAFMGDDGEKFGHWPGTHDLCYTKGWLDRFFGWVGGESAWLRTVTLSEFMGLCPPLGRVYLPTASYKEMMEWALPARRSYELEKIRTGLEREGNAQMLRYVRGGFWRNFLVKYPEANLLHKKMFRVSNAVHGSRGPDREKALDHVWQAQCNCTYWHGVFGGIYYPHLREAAYGHLIMAENLSGVPEEWRWEQHDLDGDGHEELLVEGPAQSLYFHLRNGGSLVEWDLRQLALNLVGTISRRPEAYHQKMLDAMASGELTAGGGEGAENIHVAPIAVKDAAAASRLHYDSYQRAGLIDHLLHEDATFHGWQEGTPAWVLPLPHIQRGAKVTRAGGALEVRLETEPLRTTDCTIKLHKTVLLPPEAASLRVRYHMTNLGAETLRGRFGAEFNWAVAAGSAAGWEASGAGTRGGDLAWRGAMDDVTNLTVFRSDLPLSVNALVDPGAELWIAPLETAVYSLEGVELSNQGLSTLFLWSVELAPGTDQKIGELEIRWK